MTTKKKNEERIAIVLFNLGGPTSVEAIQPFLFNFFTDKNIIRLPYPFRWLLAKMISYFRSRGEALEAYGEMGGASPLLKNTLDQQQAFEKEFSKERSEIKFFTCMRYWHPMADSVIPMVQAFNPTRVVLVSLYPQFSTTTFRSSLEDWQKYASQYGFECPTSVLCCYPRNDGFIEASAKNVEKSIKKAVKKTGEHPRVLFSAHSLPESIIKSGDSYQWQCEQTVRRIAKVLSLKKKDYRICYQSKVGPQKWLGPQTEDEIIQAGEDGVGVVIYPHAFVSEHVETIVELGIEYHEVAEEHGVPYYDVVPTVGTDSKFIKGIAGHIRKVLKKKPRIHSETAQGNSICPRKFSDCCQRTFKADEKGVHCLCN